MTDHLLSHVAMTVPRSTFTPDFVEKMAQFYESVLGWKVSSALSIENERFLINIPGSSQYLNVRASDEPMATSGYEHMGVYVKTEEEVYELHQKIREMDADVLLDEKVRTGYDGVLTTFRFQYLMPLAIEIQHIKQ